MNIKFGTILISLLFVIKLFQGCAGQVDEILPTNLVNDGFDGRLYFGRYKCFDKDSLANILEQGKNYDRSIHKYTSRIGEKNYYYNFSISNDKPCFCEVFIVYYVMDKNGGFHVIEDMGKSTDLDSKLRPEIESIVLPKVNSVSIEYCDTVYFILD